MSCQFISSVSFGRMRGVSRDSSSNGSVIKVLAWTGEFESQTDHSHE
jgi:hypothetical protein